MAVHVRRINPNEGSDLKRVRLAALADSPTAFGSTLAAERDRRDQEWTDRAVTGSAGADRATFVAVADLEIVGLVGGYRDEPSASTVELVSMWVAPGARRRGVGRALIDAVTRWADETGAATVALWVTQGNRSAEALYESVGFTATGEMQTLPSDPSKDEARMTLHLDTSEHRLEGGRGRRSATPAKSYSGHRHPRAEP